MGKGYISSQFQTATISNCPPSLTGVDLAGGGAVQVEVLAALQRAALGGGAALPALGALLLKRGPDGGHKGLL